MFLFLLLKIAIQNSYDHQSRKTECGTGNTLLKMKQQKIQMMIYLSTFFFLLELIFGYISGSIALIADSFHMLSDVASLFIALYAHNVRKTYPSSQNQRRKDRSTLMVCRELKYWEL
jgi:Co/Zn/Cd efflux system component